MNDKSCLLANHALKIARKRESKMAPLMLEMPVELKQLRKTHAVCV